MDISQRQSVNQLLAELERENERQRRLLGLQFECQFEGRRRARGNEGNFVEAPNNFPLYHQHRPQSANPQRLPPPHHRSFNQIGPASSHPSDPMLQKAKSIDEFEEMRQRAEILTIYGSRREREDIERRDEYEMVPSRLKLGNLSPINNKSTDTNTYRLKQSSSSHHHYQYSNQKSELDDVCRRLRKTSRKFDDAKRLADQRRIELQEFEERQKRDVAWDARRDAQREVNRLMMKTYLLESEKEGRKEYVSRLNGREEMGQKSRSFGLEGKSQNIQNPTQKHHRRSGSLPSSVQNSRLLQSTERLEVAAQRLPLIGKQLEHVLGLKSTDKNLVFEFIELLDRRVKICEDQLKKMLRDRCNIPKMKRQLANYEICAKQQDIKLLSDLSVTLRSHINIRPSDDYIGRREAARKHASSKVKQLEILETSIGQVML